MSTPTPHNARSTLAEEGEENPKLPPRCDPFAPSLEPYAAYSGLRAAGPLLRGGPGIWVLPRYSEVAHALREPKLGQFNFREVDGHFSETWRLDHLRDRPVNSFMRRIIVTADGAEHARLRKTMGAIFTSQLIRDLRPEVERRVDDLLHIVEDRGEFEAVSELAYPLPLQVVSRMLGIDERERDSLGRQVLALSNLFGPTVSKQDSAAADAAISSLRSYFIQLHRERVRRPKDDLMFTLVTAAKDAGLDEEATVDNAIFLMFAGLETSMNLIAAGCMALAQYPDEFSKLRERPRAAATAVNEFLRYDAPTQITGRVVLAPLQIAGRPLSKGRIVLLLLGSANHDETVFSQPERLDIERQPNPHVSFGAGPHYCVGAKLALMEAEIVFKKLTHFRRLELAGAVVRDPRATPRIYDKVPIRVGVRNFMSS
jgi:cytochrome P450